MRYFRIAILVLLSFSAGAQVQRYFYGEVRIYHNVDEGTALNHGQGSIECSFPHGFTANFVKLPDGGIFPRQDGMRWVEILPDGRHKTWIDSLSVEIVE